MASEIKTVDGRRGGAAASAPPADLVGQTISSWTIESRVAAGGFGELFRARHATTGEPVAIKVLHAEFASAPQVVARFAQEAAILAQLRHPHLVGLIELGQLPDRRPYLVMEFVEGRDLAQHLTEVGRMPLADVQVVVGQLAEALEVAHAAGIIHRDIKAANVILRAGTPGALDAVLIDFGVAKLLSSDVALTMSRQVVGTPFAMAPEQLEGKPVDARTDVYALGALVFHMLAGRPPFELDDLDLLAQLKKSAAPPSLRDYVDVPRPLMDAIESALHADPARRPVSASKLARALASSTDCPRSDSILIAIALDRIAPEPGWVSALETESGATLRVVGETSVELLVEACCEPHVAKLLTKAGTTRL